jgi:WD40 repeat protein
MDVETAESRVHMLKGHTNEVFTCAWHPHTDVIASGSADETARLWSLESGDDSRPVVLRHFTPDPELKSDVCTSTQSSIPLGVSPVLLCSPVSGHVRTVLFSCRWMVSRIDSSCSSFGTIIPSTLPSFCCTSSGSSNPVTIGSLAG